MCWACAYNNLTAVKALIELDYADLNTADNDGNTPLMMAAQQGRCQQIYISQIAPIILTINLCVAKIVH